MEYNSIVDITALGELSPTNTKTIMADDDSLAVVYETIPRKRDKKKAVRTCPICYDILEAQGDVENGNTNVAVVAGCNHIFCQPCLKEAIQTDIQAKKIPCRCPMTKCHNKWLSDDFVQAVLLDHYSTSSKQEDAIASGVDDNEAPQPPMPRSLEQYQRLMAIKRNPQSVECVKCHDVFLPSTQSDEDVKETTDQMPLQDSSSRYCPCFIHHRHRKDENAVTCPHCTHAFCKIHGDAHTTMSCREWFQTADGKRAKQSEKKLSRATKPCPNCSIRIQKVDGCDFVQCRNCHQHMCWLCNRKLEQAHQTHYCPRMWSLVALFIVGYVLYILVWIPVALVATLLSGCCAGGRFLQREREESVRLAPLRTARRVLGLVFLPFTHCCLDSFSTEYPRIEATWTWLEFEVREAWRRINARDVIPVMPVVASKQQQKEQN